MKTYNVASLFAGVGGICLGFQQVKSKEKQFKLVVSNEYDSYACETYRHNFDHLLVECDITQLFPSHLDSHKENHASSPRLENLRKSMLDKPIDVLTAGFPCQAFSIAGEAKGFDDHRGNLFLNIIQYIKTLGETHGKPKILFLENVKNLKSHDKGRTYSIIKQEIERQGYKIKDKVLNTMDYTCLPQNRERIFVVGFLLDEDYDKFTLFENIEKNKKQFSVEQRIELNKGILDDEVDDKYYYTPEKYPHYFCQNEGKVNLDRSIKERYQFYQIRRGMYVRKNQSNVCPTLTANMGAGGHNVPLILNSKGIRKLTPRETFKLQGFPVGEGYNLPEMLDNKKIGDANFYKQAGNAVSVPLITLIAQEILEIL